MFATDTFVRRLIEHIFDFCGWGDFVVPIEAQNLMNAVKLHTGDQLATAGDLSFPLAVQRWGNEFRDKDFGLDSGVFNVSRRDGRSVVDCLNELMVVLQPEVARICLTGERALVFLNRCVIFEAINSVLKAGSEYGREAKDERCVVIIRGEEDDSDEDVEVSDRGITEYRCRLVRQTLINLVGYSKFVIGEEKENEVVQMRWFVSHKSTGKGKERRDDVNILCGVVRDAGQKGNKMSEMTTSEYIR